MDQEFETLAADLCAVFEETQHQPNVNDLTSQTTISTKDASDHVPTVEVSPVMDSQNIGVGYSQTNYIMVLLV